VPESAQRWFARALLVVLVFGTLTIWVRERWAVSAFETGVFLIGAAWALFLSWRPFAPCACPPLLLLGAATLWNLALLATGKTVYNFDSVNAVLHWCAIFILFMVSFELFTCHEVPRTFLQSFLYFGFATTVLALLQHWTSGGKALWYFQSGYPDLLGPFQNRNNFAAFIELLLPVALWQALCLRGNSTLYLGMAAVMFAAVIASASRAGSALMAAELFAFFAVARLHRIASTRRVRAMALKMFVFGAIFTVVAGWRMLWQRMQDPNLLRYRGEILESTLAMIRGKPWTGFGPGTYQTAYPAFARFDSGLIVNYAHNDWLQWATEGGLPFFIMLFAVALWSIRPAIRSVWGLGLVAVYLHAIVDYPLQRLGVAAWAFVLLAAVAARHHRFEDRTQPLITPIGRSRATFRASPARSTTSITSSTFL
jgi:O-antigen ligase